MKCADCRQRLLLAENPSDADPECAGHLSLCAACKAWHGQLLTIERHVPLLPVPASKGDDQLKRLFLLPLEPAPAPAPTRPIRRVRKYFMAALALGVLIATGLILGDWAVRRMSPATKMNDVLVQQPVKPVALEEDHELVLKVLDCNLELAQTKNPRTRVEILGKLADVLSGASASLVKAGKPTELRAVAELYGKVIRDGILGRAKVLEDGRETLLEAAQKLELHASASTALAKTVGAELAEPMRQIALASREGARGLRDLSKEGAE